MTRVLIPFVDPQGARRAIAQLLAEGFDPGLRVHLLAAVEPRLSGKVRIFVSPERAAEQVRFAAQRWLEPLEQMLAAAGIPSTSEIAVGPPFAAIRAASSRPDVDRVLLPIDSYRRWGWHGAARRTLHSPHPVTRVT